MDFLQDQSQGGAFLKAHSPTDLDPQVSCIKILLARLRLFRERNPEEYLDEMMDQLWEVENRHGVAQDQLCQLIDDVISDLDHTHSDWRPQSHWCSRWGLLSEMNYFGTETDASSNSSSMNSFYSFKSPPIDRSEYLKILESELGFLAFAARNGPSRYMKQALHSRKVPLGTGAANCLLYCSIASIGAHASIIERNMAGVILTGEVLKQDIDPNMTDPFLLGTTWTMWSKFLNKMEELLHYDPHLHYMYSCSKRERIELWRTCSDTTLAFIEKGTDLHVRLGILVDTRMNGNSGIYGNISDIEDQADDSGHGYQFKVELSPVAVVELCFNGQPEITRIKEICLAKGASLYMKCTGVEIFDMSVVELNSHLIARYELSGQEFAAFLRLFERDLTSRVARKAFHHQCVKLGNTIERDRQFSSPLASGDTG